MDSKRCYLFEEASEKLFGKRTDGSYRVNKGLYFPLGEYDPARDVVEVKEETPEVIYHELMHRNIHYTMQEVGREEIPVGLNEALATLGSAMVQVYSENGKEVDPWEIFEQVKEEAYNYAGWADPEEGPRQRRALLYETAAGLALFALSLPWINSHNVYAQLGSLALSTLGLTLWLSEASTLCVIKESQHAGRMLVQDMEEMRETYSFEEAYREVLKNADRYYLI